MPGMAIFGTATVLRPGREFEVLSKNNLGEPVYASPAISRGALFVRTSSHLVCISGIAESGSSGATSQ